MAESIGKRIRRLRKESGLKQGELAREAGIPQSTLSDIEHGRTAVPGGMISLKLARALRVHPDTLLSGGDQMQAHPTPEESELLALFLQLGPASRSALLAAAKAMAEAQGSTTGQHAAFRPSPNQPKRHS